MPEGMQLAYEERGSGPVLLFVHGFPLDRRMWIGQLSGLAKIRRCVAVDLRGNGLSTVDDPDPKFSMDLFADDLATTIGELGVDQVDLCGLSMGGYVAFAFWRNYRERVRSLILCDTKAGADNDEGKAGREKTAQLVREQGMEALYEGLAPKLLANNPKPDDQQLLKDMILAQPVAATAADCLAMRDRPDSTPDLAGIDVPVLVLHGEEDNLMPIDVGRSMAEQIPRARFVGIPSGGHMAPMENPAAANEALTAFLKG